MTPRPSKTVFAIRLKGERFALGMLIKLLIIFLLLPILGIAIAQLANCRLRDPAITIRACLLPQLP